MSRASLCVGGVTYCACVALCASVRGSNSGMLATGVCGSASWTASSGLEIVALVSLEYITVNVAGIMVVAALQCAAQSQARRSLKMTSLVTSKHSLTRS